MSQYEQMTKQELIGELEALKKREERLWTLVESVPAAVYEADAKGACLYVNEEWRELTGLTLEEALGDRWQEGLHKEDRAHVFQLWKEHAKHQEPWDMEYRFCTPDGKVSWVMGRAVALRGADGRVAGYVGANIDITERRRAEEALRLQAAIMSGVAEGVYLIGLDDLIIRWTNERFAQLFGYEPGELVGQPVDIVNAPTDLTPAETRASIIDVLEEAGEWHGEVENIKRDGTHFWCYANVSLFDHPQYGKIMVAVHTDITNRKRAEEEVLDSRDRLRRLTIQLDGVREEERTALARELHDDVGQAMTAMRMDLDLIEGELPEGQETLADRIHSMIDLTDDALERVNRLSHDLRSPVLEMLGLESAVEAEVEDYQQRWETEVSLELDVGTLEVLPERDSTLHRILKESLSNVRRHAQAGRIEVSLRVSGEDLVLEVLDDGIGIEDDRSQGQRSFGLIGMRERAERLGGRVEIRRREEGGTALVASIPLEPTNG